MKDGIKEMKECYLEMISYGIMPSSSIIAAIIHFYFSGQYMNEALFFYKDALTRGVDLDNRVFNAMLSGYGTVCMLNVFIFCINCNHSNVTKHGE
jgi:hypothetical protein